MLILENGRAVLIYLRLCLEPDRDSIASVTSMKAGVQSLSLNINVQPSHLTDIDHGKSVLVDKLSNVANNAELHSSKGCAITSHCSGDPNPLEWGSQTLFVNASVEGTEDFPLQPPWLIDLELPAQ